MSIWLANIVATMRDDPGSSEALLSDGIYLRPSDGRDEARKPERTTTAARRRSQAQEPQPAEPWELAWIRR